MADDFTDNDAAVNDAIGVLTTLVSYHTKTWSGRIRDVAAAQAAAKVLGITTSSLSTTKNLMDGADTRLRAITSAQEAGRQDHARLTLPWTTDAGSRGPRMLPNVKWLEYMQTIGKADAVYKAALADFLQEYETDAIKAQKRINMVGDPLKLYPSKDKIAEHFSLEVEFDTIPVGVKFKGLPPGWGDKLKESIEAKIEKRMTGALAEAYLRTHTAVKNLAERLSVEEPTFKSAAVENVRELGPMLKAWNIYNDENLAILAGDVEKLVANEDMKSLKANEQVRRLVAKEAHRIVAMIEEWEVLP